VATPLQIRFEAKVDRSGPHHLWTGSKKADGSGTVKVDGRVVMARRVAWELVHGSPGADARVLACPGEPSCVRVEHLRVAGGNGNGAGTPAEGQRTHPQTRPAASGRARKGSGSMREVRPGVWELAATIGRYSDGRVRRVYRTVRTNDAAAAARELAALVAEARIIPVAPPRADLRDLTVDDAIELFLSQHLRDEKGREERTIEDYRDLHVRWFSPHIGARQVREVDEGLIDSVFGRMRRAGLSRSRLNHAKSLYAPFFRWAKTRRIITRNPMADFQLPTSQYVSKQRTPPEVEELSLLLAEAVLIVPDVAPLLVLGAVTGMRRGELVGIRRSRLVLNEGRITVDLAVDEKRRVKGTKTRRDRSFHVDVDTMAMLSRHCDRMDERAAACGTLVGPDAFIFSLEPDCSKPMYPDYVTKQVQHLKNHLGIAEKRPETIVLEDEALRLYRLDAQPRPQGMKGVHPKGGLPYHEIGRRLGRSERWATLAIRAAECREAAATRNLQLSFDGSILALRKFTSSELLDAGFNISMVAQRQGHGPQVLIQHYSKSRRSADRRAAEHLGRAIHGPPNHTDADKEASL
jgi:integrase